MTRQEFSRPFGDLQSHFGVQLGAPQIDLWYNEFRDVTVVDFADGCYAVRRFLQPTSRFPSMDKLHAEIDRARDRRLARRRVNTQGKPILDDLQDGSPATTRYIANIRRIVNREITAADGMAEYWKIRKQHGDGLGPEAEMDSRGPTRTLDDRSTSERYSGASEQVNGAPGANLGDDDEDEAPEFWAY